jgi:pimeloyl-ACP methyl ester carboxylesterase
MKIDRRQSCMLMLASVVSSGWLQAKPSSREELRAADGRSISLDVWRPSGKAIGRIHFSHGAASSPWKYSRLLEPLCAAGYEIWAPLHVDSTEHPSTNEFKGMASWAARLQDMQALSLMANSNYIAMGHSYGALVSLTLGGARPAAPVEWRDRLRDPAASVVVALSPPGPLPGFVDAQAYSSLEVPALIQTGDRDIPLGWEGARWQDHLVAFDAAKATGSRYALVLEGVDHYFGSAICRPELPVPPQLAMLSSTVEIIQLFIAAHGFGDGATAVAASRDLSKRLVVEGPVRLSRK